MDLTILGCRSGMPADGEASSGYLVNSGSTRLLLDCGPGVATALSAVSTADQLDAVVISHLHIDHCYDLLPLGKALLSGYITYPATGGADTAGMLPRRPPPRGTPVPLYLPAGGRDLLTGLAALFPLPTIPVLNRTTDLAFAVHEYSPGDVIEVGDCSIRLAELAHSVPNCGMRVDSPTGSLVYTGDTGVTAALKDLAEGADLLLAEATLGRTDHGPHGHLSAGDAGRVATQAGVGRLVLTHYASSDPEWTNGLQESAEAEFDGLITIARPAARIAVRTRQEAGLPD